MTRDPLCTLLVYGGHAASEIRDWLVLAYSGTGPNDAAYGLAEARKALARVNAAFDAYDREQAAHAAAPDAASAAPVREAA